ncbi:Single-strand binding protein family protein [Salegentibacter salinarum]|uniref:single-stranded DNA-binding protein n=1 Tax=Salegentibacter salinarum TaxID=447422 RepID=UPI0009C53FC8|nr:single-stranded DNA-binding protein [Salegentibacter salinarum]SKC02037.1 Single-strand binding protein family protein [Salegentibacter salinarum]
MKTLRNTVQLIGNVGEDPKSHRFENGMLVCRFSLATNEQFLKTERKFRKHNGTSW